MIAKRILYFVFSGEPSQLNRGPGKPANKVPPHTHPEPHEGILTRSQALPSSVFRSDLDLRLQHFSFQNKAII